MRLLLAATVLIATVSVTTAAELHYKRFAVDVEPGGVLRQELSCPKEQLISGGFGLEDIKGGPPASLVLAANTFADEGTWRVEFYNSHDAMLKVDFGITVLCD